MAKSKVLMWAIVMASVFAPVVGSGAPPPPGPVRPLPGPPAFWKMCGKCNGHGVVWDDHRWKTCGKCDGRGWLYDKPDHHDRDRHHGNDNWGYPGFVPYCFVATAAYGTAWEPNVVTLRTFRDECLLHSPVGQGFVSFYYDVSPPLANWIADRPWARAATRVALTPAVTVAGAFTGNRHDMAIVGGAIALAFVGVPRLRRAAKRRRARA
jgi:hypothetical protein